MKITERAIRQALKDLEDANGSRKKRIITPDQLTAYIDEANKLYSDNAGKKYFRGVAGRMPATYDDKPKSYSYKAYQTTVAITATKGQPAKIEIMKDYWNYTPAKAHADRLRIVWD